MGGGRGKLKAPVPLTAAERLQRARERLAEVRAQLTDVGQRTAARQSSLAGLRGMAASALLAVQRAADARDAAETAVVDAQAAFLMAEGTGEESAAAEAVATAERASAELAAEVQRAEESAAATSAKVETEIRELEQLLADDERGRRDLARLATSLERQEAAAHAAAGLERLAQLRAERAALDARRAELREMAAAAEADLTASYAAVDELMREWPAIADAREVRELRPAPLAALHEVAAACVVFCDVLERHVGSPTVYGFWRNQANVPRVLEGLGGALGEIFAVFGASRLPQVQAARAQLRALSAAAAEHEVQIFEQLPRVLEHERAESEGETTPAA